MLENFDLSIYLEAAVNGVPITAVVVGLVWWYGKAFNLQGRAQYISSMITGVLLGGAYMLFTTPLPAAGGLATAGYIFSIIVYGLGLGVLASALYETGLDALSKVLARAQKKPQ